MTDKKELVVRYRPTGNLWIMVCCSGLTAQQCLHCGFRMVTMTERPVIDQDPNEAYVDLNALIMWHDHQLRTDGALSNKEVLDVLKRVRQAHQEVR